MYAAAAISFFGFGWLYSHVCWLHLPNTQGLMSTLSSRGLIRITIQTYPSAKVFFDQEHWCLSSTQQKAILGMLAMLDRTAFPTGNGISSKFHVLLCAYEVFPRNSRVVDFRLEKRTLPWPHRPSFDPNGWNWLPKAKACSMRLSSWEYHSYNFIYIYYVYI